VLECASGATNTQVADRLGVARATVGKWRSRFIADRLDGLADEPRPGAPRKTTDEQVENVLTDTLESTPSNATHWSRSSMADKSGLSQSTVGRIWKAFGLEPHRAETFKLSKDPMLIEKARDVVGLHLDPPDKAVALCVDEKSQVQALDRSQPVPPMMPGMPEKRTHDYVRDGVTSLFAALDMATGNLIGAPRRRHRSTEHRKFLVKIDKEVPKSLDVRIICDNHATHKTDTIQRWPAARPRFHACFIPTSSSWLNMVERWFGELTAKLLQRGVHTNVQALEADIRAWIATWNEDPKPYIWTKTADEILDSIAAFCQRTSGAGH
jgi:transposase